MPTKDTAAAPDLALPASPAEKPLKQPAALEEPQAGGSYTRCPVNGVLTLVTPSTDNT